MRDFSKISPSVWASRKFGRLESAADRLLYLYLLSCPHGNAIGCFQLSTAYALHDTKFSEQEYRDGIDTLCDVGLIAHDTAEDVVRICNWFSFNEPTNPKHAMGMLREFPKVPSEVLGRDCFNEFMVIARKKNFAAYDNFKAAADTLSKGYAEGISTRPEGDQTERETVSHAAERSIDEEVKPVKGEDPPGFAEFWNTYPNRLGSKDRKAAVKAFGPAVKRAGNRDTVIWGAGKYRDEMRAKGKIDTEYVKQARTWLNADGWKEYQNGGRSIDATPVTPQVVVIVNTPQWEAWRKHKGKSSPEKDIEVGGRYVRGWWFPSEWPPGHQPTA